MKQPFFDYMSSQTPEQMAEWTASMNAKGFHNHVFAPSGKVDKCHCVWECSEDASPEDFQKFIDGEEGANLGAFFDNECHKVAAGGFVPDAKFA